MVTVAAAASVRVKLATLVAKGTSMHAALQEMGEQWHRASDGEVALTLFTDGSMGAEADMVRRIRNGQLQAALLTATGLATIAPDVASLQDIPLAFRTLDEAAWVREQLAPRFERSLATEGFVVLGWCDFGWWRLFSTKPLREPDDLRGELLNIGTDNPDARTALARALDLQPVALLPTDLLPALQSGRITITPAPPMYALSAQLFTAAPHMLELNWSPLVGGIVLSQETWSSLTALQQEAVRNRARTAAVAITSHARREMAEAVAAMQARGLHVQSIAPASAQAWADFSDRARRAARGTLVREAAYDEIIQLTTAYRQNAAVSSSSPPTPVP
jgi:TRAP-type C4-dicarboxylate transport system substrate-binding protein